MRRCLPAQVGRDWSRPRHIAVEPVMGYLTTCRRQMLLRGRVHHDGHLVSAVATLVKILRVGV